MSRPNAMQADDIRVRELVESAMQADTRGQSRQAEQLLRLWQRERRLLPLALYVDAAEIDDDRR